MLSAATSLAIESLPYLSSISESMEGSLAADLGQNVVMPGYGLLDQSRWS